MCLGGLQLVLWERYASETQALGPDPIYPLLSMITSGHRKIYVSPLLHPADQGDDAQLRRIIIPFCS